MNDILLLLERAGRYRGVRDLDEAWIAKNRVQWRLGMICHAYDRWYRSGSLAGLNMQEQAAWLAVEALAVAANICGPHTARLIAHRLAGPEPEDD